MSNTHSMEIELYAELEFDLEPYFKGTFDEPASGGTASLNKITIGKKELPHKEWAEYGFDAKRIRELEEKAAEEAANSARDYEDARGDDKYHELKDEGRI